MRRQTVLSALAFALAALLAKPAVAEDRIPIVDEGGIGEAWGLAAGTRLAMPRYPAKHAEDPQPLCLAVGYLLNADGHASDFALLQTWSEDSRPSSYWEDFANETVAAMNTWRFLPLPGVTEPKPVYTVSTFVFSAPDAIATRERCQIGNLARHLLEMREDPRTQRMMARLKIFSKLDIDPTLETRLSMDRRMGGHKVGGAAPPPPPPRAPPPPPPGGG